MLIKLLFKIIKKFQIFQKIVQLLTTRVRTKKGARVDVGVNDTIIIFVFVLYFIVL